MSQDVLLALTVLGAALLAFLISFGSMPLVKTFAKTVGAIDVPLDNRRMHKTPIPRLGGLAIYLGFIFSVLLFVQIDRQMQGILLGSVVIVVLGVLDDILRLKAWIKFIVQILASLIPVYCGVVIDVISNPNFLSRNPYWSLGIWGIPVTVLWIVGMTNAVNFIDGLDGLSVGVSTIASFSMLVIALLVSEGNIAIIMAALCGACIGFMPYNMNPAKIFMGDTGATFLGFTLACVSIQGLFKFYAIVSFAVPFLVLGLPLFETVYTILRRLRKGRSPMSADRGHVHHRLIDMGFSQKQSVAILYTMSALLGLSAVILTSSGEIKALLLVLGVVAAVAIGGKVLSSGESGGDNKKQEDDPHGKD